MEYFAFLYNCKKLKIFNMSEIATSDKIFLHYLGEINSTDIDFIKEKLKEVNIEFMARNSSGSTQNSLDAYSLDTFYVVAAPFIYDLLKHVGENTVWESLKTIFIFTKNKIKDKKLNRVTSQEITQKQIKFGLRASLDKNTSFNFELSGDLSDELFEKSLDKMLDFLREQTLNEKYEFPAYAKFSEQNEEWEAEFESDYIKKLANNPNK
ncbi:hypothetical protein PG593_03795 [Riemerella anatipestifer]|nr:hypothetical protein [Riemerella anatipestifer]